MLTGFYSLVWGDGSFRLNLGLLPSLGSEYLLDLKNPTVSRVYLGDQAFDNSGRICDNDVVS